MRELTLDEMDRISGGNRINPPTDRPPPYDNDSPFGNTQYGLWGDLNDMLKRGEIFTVAATVISNPLVLAGEAADAAVKLAAQVAPSEGAYVCAKVGDCSRLVLPK